MRIVRTSVGHGGRPSYEKPVVFLLNRTEEGKGNCTNGSADEG
jgi:hypothetical protein